MHISLRRFSIFEEAANSALRRLSNLLMIYITPFGIRCINQPQSPFSKIKV